MAPKHKLTVVDRGAGHIHRYTAYCRCGWVGVHRRTRADAADLYREHVNGDQSRRSDARMPRPRPTTPADQLPEELK